MVFYQMKGGAVAMDNSRLAKYLKALADEKRLQIIRILGRRSMCVCELESLLALSQPALSHHLRILREAGVVTNTRKGKWIFYSLQEGNYNEILSVLTVLPGAIVENFPENEIDFCMSCEYKKKLET